MSDKEKIKNEIERRKKFYYDRYTKKGIGCIEENRYDECVELLDFINSLPEEPVSEDLEESARNYGDELDSVLSVAVDDDNSIGEYATQAFKAGANWQKEQMPCWKKGTLSDTPWGVNSDYLTNPEGYYIELSKLLKLPKES